MRLACQSGEVCRESLSQVMWIGPMSHVRRVIRSLRRRCCFHKLSTAKTRISRSVFVWHVHKYTEYLYAVISQINKVEQVKVTAGLRGPATALPNVVPFPHPNHTAWLRYVRCLSLRKSLSKPVTPDVQEVG